MASTNTWCFSLVCSQLIEGCRSRGLHWTLSQGACWFGNYHHDGKEGWDSPHPQWQLWTVRSAWKEGLTHGGSLLNSPHGHIGSAVACPVAELLLPSEFWSPRPLSGVTHWLPSEVVSRVLAVVTDALRSVSPAKHEVLAFPPAVLSEASWERRRQ